MNIEERITNSMFKLSYGLYVLSAKNGDKQNACIINTVMQVTDTPKTIAITVNKMNFTSEMISTSGEFNISVLTQKAPFDLFKHFGFQSGKDVNKIDGTYKMPIGANGINYLAEYTNVAMSCKSTNMIDCGTHIMFIANVIDAKIICEDKSVTYEYYFENIKPKKDTKAKKGFVCKICGYVYEGETLPADFICPLCKHPASDFEPLA